MTYDLSDVTFMIPVKIDSEDRVINLNIITMYLRHHFTTNIIIAEQSANGAIQNLVSNSLYDTYILYKVDSFYFHKARLVNVMAKVAKTPIIAMYDSDILLEPHQYTAAVNELRSNRVDFIYPFNGKVINIPKKNVSKVFETLKFDFVSGSYTNNKDLAMGGCVMYNRAKFIEGGMMNEKFVSYGPEDGEQDVRFKKLGNRSNRINNPLYHLDHVRTENSMENHKYSSQNWSEFNKIKTMSISELRQYVNTWEWAK